MDLQTVFKKAWDIYRRNFGLVLAATLVAGFLSGISLFILAGPLLAGLAVLLLRLARGEEAGFNLIFSRFDKFVPALILMLAMVVVSLLISIIGVIPILGWIIGPVLLAIVSSMAFLGLAVLAERDFGVVSSIQFGLNFLISRPLLLAVAGGYGLGLTLLGWLLPGGFLYFLLTTLASPFFLLFLASAAAETNQVLGDYRPDQNLFRTGGIILAVLLVAGILCWAIGGYSPSLYISSGSGTSLISGSRGTAVIPGLTQKTRDEQGREVTVTLGGKLPSGFPGDVPVYKGATVVSSSRKDGEVAVIFSVEEGAQKVYDYYLNELPRKGWRLSEEGSVILFAGMTGEKGNRQVSVLVMGDDQTATITISVQGL